MDDNFRLHLLFGGLFKTWLNIQLKCFKKMLAVNLILNCDNDHIYDDARIRLMIDDE